MTGNVPHPLPAVAVHLAQRGGFSLNLIRSADLSPAERALPPHRQPVGWRLVQCPADPVHCRALMAQARAPAAPTQVIARLGHLAKLVRATREDAADWDGLIRVFTHRIAGHYPAAVVTIVLDGWADTERFWPAWCDLKSRLDRETAILHRICQQLEEALAVCNINTT